MWRIEHINALSWWLIIPAIILYVYYLRRKRNKQLKALGSSKRIHALIQSSSHQQNILKRSIWLVAFALLIIALSNPQIGKEEQSVSNRGGNVIVALDLSNSMLAKDIAPNRLERSKKMLTHFAEKVKGDRVAFIVFAGKAYIQMPFTTDYGAFKLYLQSIQTDMIPFQGTNLREAIALAESMQGIKESEEKVLVILSDGEDHDKKAVALAKQVASKNMIIHTIGVGTPMGSAVPESSALTETKYKTDGTGQQVVSKLNEDMLKDIAAAGGGKYFNISNERKAIKEIQRSIKWSSSDPADEHIYSQYKSYYQWFLFPAILLLMLELAGVHILSFRKDQSVKSFVFILFFIPFLAACNSNASKSNAFQHFEKENYSAAVKTYQKILQKDSTAENWYNLGSTYLKLTQMDSAASIFQHILSIQPDSSIASKAHFNLGVVFYTQQEYRQSADAFKGALKFQPNNYRSQYNLSLALSHLSPEDQNEEDQENENEENEQDQESDSNDSDQQGDNNKHGDGDNNNEEKQNKDQEEGEESGNDQQKDDKKDESNQQSNHQNELSPMDMKKLYQSLDQQEKVIQKRIMGQQGKDQQQPLTEKDW